MDKRLEKAYKEFKLSQKEIDAITNIIIQFLKTDKTPSSDPIAIIVGGQSGAGKTALMAHAGIEFSNSIFIDNDLLRSFHPQAHLIRSKYPEYYTELTDQLGIDITSKIVDYFMGNNENGDRYDIIFHQTLKNNRIVDDAMTKFHNAGYTVIVRALAVSYFESKISQLERCMAQYNSVGFCRHVDPETHCDAIKGIPYTVSYMEETGKYDLIQIYVRTSDISKPKLIYSKANPQSRNNLKHTFKQRSLEVPENLVYDFNSAKTAIKRSRQIDSYHCVKTLQGRIDNIINLGGYDVPGMAVHIDEIQKELNNFIEKHNLYEVCVQR